MKCGYAIRLITPPIGDYLGGDSMERKITSVRDDLFARIVTFNDDKNIVVFTSLDLLGPLKNTEDQIRQTIMESTGIDKKNIFLCSTHTHTGPVSQGTFFPINHEYFRNLGNIISDGIKEAVKGEKESVLCWADTTIDNIAFIRRFRMKDGSSQTNPGWRNPNIVKPIGEADNTLRVLNIKREGANNIILVNFQVHADVIRAGLAHPEIVETFVSADFPGILVKTLEGALDNTKAVYFGGCAGDLNHINVNSPEWDENDGVAQCEHMGRSIAGKVLEVCTKARPLNTEKGIKVLESEFTVPLRTVNEEEVEHAKYIMDSFNSGKLENIPYPPDDMRFTTTVFESNNILKLNASGETQRPMTISVVQIGDFVAHSMSAEPFCEIGKLIRQASPSKHTFTLAICNGKEGYLPLMEAFNEGGYEARTSEFKPGVGELIVDTTKQLLNQL